MLARCGDIFFQKRSQDHGRTWEEALDSRVACWGLGVGVPRHVSFIRMLRGALGEGKAKIGSRREFSPALGTRSARNCAGLTRP